MRFQATTATKKLLKLRKRIRGIPGGTSASKTISILLILIDYAQSQENKIISIVSETVPHLRRGAMRDFLNIMRSHHYYDDKRWNRTDSIYTFETGTIVEFFAADQADKLRGGRRDVLFINEANNVSHNAYNELEIRTRETVWLDWNPVTTFWWYEDILPYHDVDFITLTYKDNEALEESIIQSIESRKHSNPNWYKVYALGQLGKLEGLIYSNWEIIDEVPDGAELKVKGLDFGYTNDPTAVEAVYKWNDGYVIDEELYATGLSNRDIAQQLKAKDQCFVIADSAEPKSIDEIKSYGIDITGSTKGRGSVNQGIQLVQDVKLYITKRSVSTIRDFRNYQWKTDKNDKPLNIPAHEFSHSPDAVRYALSFLLGGNLLTVDDIAL